MEGLTKENFWNEMMQTYPDAMDVFCKWIDNYKKEIHWDKYFPNPKDPRILGIKFHDLPFEFQNGVIARFDIECFNGVLTGKGKAMYEIGRPGFVTGFVNLFKDFQNQLNKQKQ